MDEDWDMADFDQPIFGGDANIASLSTPYIQKIDNIFAVTAGVLLFLIMIMTAIDVAGRYLFSAPLGFAYEMTELGMVSLALCALPSVTLRGQHVTVDLLEKFFQGRLKACRDALVSLLMIAACAYLAWRLGSLAERFWDYGERTHVLKVPTGAVAAIGSLMLAITAMVTCIPLWESLRRLRQGDA